MADWSQRVARSGQVCSVTGRSIAPGEVYHSLLETLPDGTFRRVDLCAEAWDPGRAAASVSWWRRKAADGRADQRRKLDLEALERTLEDLLANGGRSQACLAWVLALWLVRARRWREVPAGPASLIIENRARSKRLSLRDPGMDASQEASVADGLRELLTMAEVVEEVVPGGPIEAGG